MATDTTVNELVINKLTQAQYDALTEKSPTELYFVTDAKDNSLPLDIIDSVEKFPQCTVEDLGKLVIYTGPTTESTQESVQLVLDGTIYNGHIFGCIEVNVTTENESVAYYMWKDVYESLPTIGDDVAGKVLSNNGLYPEWVDMPEGDKLPDQTDNAGKFLTTDGENVSWGNAVANTATQSNQLNITTLNGAAITPDRSGTSINIGENIYGGKYNDRGGIRIGKNINTMKENFASGVYIAHGGVEYAGGGVIISGHINSIYGNNSGKIGGIIISGFGNLKIVSKGVHSTLIGSIDSGENFMLKADYTTAIVNGASTGEVTEDNTFWWGNQNGLYKLFDTDGTIPTDRYTITPTNAGTYVPKLTIAEDGTATREWGTESSGDWLSKAEAAATYLPLSGGSIDHLTFTNNANYIGFKLSGSYKVSMRPLNPEMLTTTAGLGLSETILSFGWDDWSARFKLFLDTGTQKLFPAADNSFSLGLSERRWGNVYTHKLNNGADIAVPTTGGTMVVATPPTDNGTYVLKATVVDGVVTTEWVLEA